jgi:hypothetical protein
MNRHERRRARALGRGRRTGYLHRLVAAHAKGAMPAKPGVHFAAIEHDASCSIYRGHGCDCVPDISISSADGVTVIGEDGSGRKVARS